MGYYETALLTNDMEFLRRVAACYAMETRSGDPESWAAQNIWKVASAPTFGEKYSYAVNAENPAPGRDPAVISDGDILAVVQALLTQEN